MNHKGNFPKINTGVFGGKDFYFTLSNSKSLYVLHEDKRIEVVVSNIFTTNRYGKFCNMFEINGCIWLIPMFEEDIFIYDINNKKTEKILLDEIVVRCYDYPKCRDAILIDDNIWILSNDSKAVMKINVLTKEKIIFNDWPKEVMFEKKEHVDFKNMALYEKKLYLFPNDCNHSVVIDTETGKMETKDLLISKDYAEIIEGKLIKAPKKKSEVLVFCDINTFEQNEKKLMNSIWDENKNATQFWRIRKNKKHSFVCPYMAKEIIMINNIDNNIDYIDLSDYCSDKPLIIWDVVEYAQGYYILPEDGSFILNLKNDMQIECISLDLELFEIIIEKNGIIQEESEADLYIFLDDFIKDTE